MGSITKRPKAPTVQPYVPPTVTPVTSVETPVEPEKTDSEIAAEAREKSLLRRSRGRFGTVLTSFKGFLSSANDGEAPRKTLLGE